MANRPGLQQRRPPMLPAVPCVSIVIDLSRMRSVEVDADARAVRVAGGAPLGDVARLNQNIIPSP